MKGETRMDARAFTEKKARRARVGKLRPGEKLLLEHLLPYLADFIRSKGAPRPPRGLAKPIQALSSDDLALSALWPILRGRNRRNQFADTKLCIEIGRNVCDRRLMKKLDRQTRARVKKRPGKLAWRYLRPDWSEDDCIAVGNWLVNCALQLDFFEVDENNLPKIADKHQPAVDKMRADLVWRDPVYLPHRYPPPDWTEWRTRYDDRISARFVRSYYANTRPAIDRAFQDPEWEHARGVNALQRVPLRINDFMLPVVERFAPAPEDMDFIAPDWAVARYLAGKPFWLTYNCDRRGRLNALPHFHYMREDHVRSLFMFDRGLQIGLDDVDWLEIHVANCHGETDKKSWPDRLNWTLENRDLIRRVADDPIASYDEWKDVDAPFCFVAGCRELVSAWDGGPTFVTHLPCSFDGSNNGCQHYACLLGDIETATKVNLINLDYPQDAYADVITRAQSIMSNDDLPVARRWDERLGAMGKSQRRKLLKTPAMTFGYGATPVGMADQIGEVYRKKVRVAPPEYGDRYYLGNVIIKASREVFPRVAEAMDFIRGRASACSANGVPLEWISPTGFPVSNLYQEPKTRRVKLIRDGVEIKRTVAEGHEPAIRVEKAENSAPANFIHSLDASHLIRIAIETDRRGIDLLTIHDCFACLAPHARELHQVLRSQMAVMYLQDNFERLGGDKPPARGDLDPIKIQDAEYPYA